jgi:hypothetical protein
MTDFFSGDVILTNEEIRQALYSRLAIIRAVLDEPFPDWYNPHDFGSGYLKGCKKSAELEYKSIANILDKMERS